METIIQTKGLTKVYKTDFARIYALNNVDLEIGRGEFCAVVGTSGCGKSTLLSLLAGLDKPSAGKIQILGKAVHRMDENQLVTFRLKSVGFVFQAFHLMNHLTVIENIAFPLMIKGIGKKKRELKAMEVIKKLGLTDHAGLYPNQLSGGQQQRVSIGRAIITKPKLLFADEPTGNLDSENAEQIINIFRREIADNGTTVIMVTHDVERARNTDRIIHLSDGKLTRIEIPEKEFSE